jgi:ABC-type transport system involved in multi-copper enzyme maturation permease subunit
VQVLSSTLEDVYLDAVGGAETPGRRDEEPLEGRAVVAAHALRESLRRRVFVVVLALTVAFGGLYAWGVDELFSDVDEFGGGEILDARTLAGATILGLAMFGTLFLGVVLAVFLTLNAVRGDAERGLLQPVVVRPLGRGAYLLGRWAAAAAVSASYVVVVFLGAVAITELVGGYAPDRIVAPALELAGAVAIVSAVALLGSVALGTTANGIGVLMVFGAGLLVGLLGSIGDALSSETLSDVANVASWVLPFEGLYRDALFQLVADAASRGGVTGALVQLGPLGGSHDNPALFPLYCVGYAAAVGGLALLAFRRRDL